MIMIIIKLIINKKNIHTLTHTQTAHPGGLGRQKSHGSDEGRRIRGTPPTGLCAPVNTPATPLLQGGVCVWCVRLVGIGGELGEQWQRLDSHSTFLNIEQTLRQDGRSAPHPLRR